MRSIISKHKCSNGQVRSITTDVQSSVTLHCSLSVKVRSCALHAIKRRCANHAGIGSSALECKYCARSHYYRLIFQKLKQTKKTTKYYSKKLKFNKNTETNKELN
jgi:hypothetical protein